MLIYETCQNWVVNQSALHINIALCEDHRKAGEMMHFKDSTEKN